jgi:hypothetical protein
MEAAGFTPLEPYRNVSSPWKALCERCGQISSPNLNNVRTRGACCAHCTTYGLDPGAPALLYILVHLVYGAVKIGITGALTREDRIARFRGTGWSVVRTLPFTTGATAYRVEQATLKQLRAQGLTPFLTAAQMPAGGWTETFDAAQVSADRLWRMALAARQEAVPTRP